MALVGFLYTGEFDNIFFLVHSHVFELPKPSRYIRRLWCGVRVVVVGRDYILCQGAILGQLSHCGISSRVLYLRQSQ